MIGVCGSPVAHRLELRMVQLSVSPAMLEYTTSITLFTPCGLLVAHRQWSVTKVGSVE